MKNYRNQRSNEKKQNNNMKYRLSLLALLLAVTNFSYSQKQGYMSKFSSIQQIRSYYKSNILALDPLEGEYDTQMGFTTNSPFMEDESVNDDLFIVKDPLTKIFHIYALDNGILRESTTPRFESIGTTNAYRVYYGNSSNRAVLENNIRLKVNIELSPQDAKNFASNQRFSYRIIISFDFVKKYPTAAMYSQAARKAQEDAQPKEWTGTGFALNNNYIVTNYHVVDGAKTISIQGINGDFNHKYQAEVVATDNHNDLAIIKVKGINIPSASIPYAVKTATSEVGEEVFVLGYPLTSTMGEEIKLTTGVISSKTGFQGDVSIYQISAPIQPGNSGGPLFDSKGNVVGIVSAKHKGAENVGYAIKTSYLRNLMESAISTNILPQANKMAGQNLSGKVKMAKKCVYYITCSSSHSNSPTNSFSYSDSQVNNEAISESALHLKPSYNSRSSLVITDVEISNKYTALHCQYTNTEYDAGGWYSIESGAHIFIKASGKKFVLNNTRNCALSPNTTASNYMQTKNFVLYFPPIPKDTREFDFVESPGSPWNIKGIKLTKQK